MNSHIQQRQEPEKKRAKPSVKTLFLLSKFEFYLLENSTNKNAYNFCSYAPR
jgi:hypothetical protein